VFIARAMCGLAHVTVAALFCSSSLLCISNSDWATENEAGRSVSVNGNEEPTGEICHQYRLGVTAIIPILRTIKLQYTLLGDYWECVLPAWLPVSTWVLSSIPLGTLSKIRSSSGPRRLQQFHRTHNRCTQIYMPKLYSCCVTCIACISERKYMFCLTENLQFFLDCNTVSYHINHNTVNLYGHQSYLSIQTPLSTIQTHYFHQVNTAVFTWGCQQQLSKRRVCVCIYSVVQVFLRWWKKSFYLPVMCYIIFLSTHFHQHGTATLFRCWSLLTRLYFHINMSNKSTQHPPRCRVNQLCQHIIQHWKRTNDYDITQAQCTCKVCVIMNNEHLQCLKHV